MKPCTSPRSIQEGRPHFILIHRSLYALLAFSFLFFTCSILFSDETLIHLRPYPKPNLSISTNLSHIVFGISSSGLTWDRLREYNELWWRPQEMHGYIWLDENPPADVTWPDTVPPYRICKSNSSVLRVAKTVVETYRAVQFNTRLTTENRWFIIGDDATIFFPDNLVAMLRNYNHGDMYYIGSISESVEQDLVHSYGMAYGGAGFAISYKAAAELALIMDVCLEQYHNLYGSDERIQSCLSELGLSLTLEPGFHQVDLRGNIYGMLAAHPVAPLLSLNRMNFVPPISPLNKNNLEALKSLVDVSKHDPSRTLQQAICYEHGPGFNWSISVSWGYTVQIYPWSIAPRELVKPLMTFTTWRTCSSGPFTFDARPINENQTCELPLTFFLDQARAETGLNGIRRTVTDYLRNDLYKNVTNCTLPSFTKAFKLQRVRVLATKMDPDEWEHAPRRHCCRTSRARNGKMLTVQISQCAPGQRASWQV
ncbi:hypothetical protein LUZ60_012934 [Juncus effusus]|nr:hypothetical protein LUZ60_012934 [Juncus effusus]